MKKFLFILISILMITGCSVSNKATIEAIELDEDLNSIMFSVGNYLYSCKIPQEVKMINIKGVHYLNGDKSDYILNSRVPLNNEIEVSELKILLQVSDDLKVNNVVYQYNGSTISGSSINSSNDFKYQSKKYLNGKLEFELNKEINILVLTGDKNKEHTNIADYTNNEDLIKAYSDIVLYTIVFSDEWREREE